VPFTVVGVLDKKGQTTWGQDQDDLIVVPLSTAKRKLLGVSQANARSVNSISVRVRDDADIKEAEIETRELLRQRHRLQPYQDDDFSIRNLAELAEAQEASSRVMTILLAAVASVSLFVGGIGIMNIMLVSVTERTREIGLRMAVGARGRDILTQFLVEAVTLAMIGGRTRRGGGHHGLLHHSVFRRLAHPHQRRGYPHRLRLRGGGGDLLRLLSRPQGGAAQPHRGLEIRMIARLLPTMLLAALWTFPALAQT